MRTVCGPAGETVECVGIVTIEAFGDIEEEREVIGAVDAESGWAEGMLNALCV